MGTYALRRLAQVIPVLFLVTLLAFAVTMLLPGDPALAVLGMQGAKDPQAYAAMRRELGLDRALPVQYVSWLGRVVTGNFGRSAVNHQPVLAALRERLPVTLELGLLSMIVATLVAVPLGMWAAMRRDTVVDQLTSVVALAGIAMPSFWLAILLINLCTLRFQILPASGYVSFGTDPGEHLKHLLLPVIVLAAESAAGLMRQVRSAMLEVLGQDYIRTARSKGLTNLHVVGVHALRNALIPVVTIVGLRVARLLGGAAVVESVFAIPGLGRLAVESIFNRDFPVIQSIVLIMALAVLLSNLATDLLYGFFDPRIRYA